MLELFVADPDLGSGAFLTLDLGWKNSVPGSGSVCIFNSSGVFFVYELLTCCSHDSPAARAQRVTPGLQLGAAPFHNSWREGARASLLGAMGLGCEASLTHGFITVIVVFSSFELLHLLLSNT
jgi:hypothetical protein